VSDEAKGVRSLASTHILSRQKPVSTPSTEGYQRRDSSHQSDAYCKEKVALYIYP
jgi:hypothetical protein